MHDGRIGSEHRWNSAARPVPWSRREEFRANLLVEIG